MKEWTDENVWKCETWKSSCISCIQLSHFTFGDTKPREAKHLPHSHAELVPGTSMFYEGLESFIWTSFMLNHATPGFCSSDFQEDKFYCEKVSYSTIRQGLSGVTLDNAGEKLARQTWMAESKLTLLSDLWGQPIRSRNRVRSRNEWKATHSNCSGWLSGTQGEPWSSREEAVNYSRKAGVRKAWVYTAFLLFIDTVTLSRFLSYTRLFP